MIGFAVVGTNDMPRARDFYDPPMPLLGTFINTAWSTDGRVWSRVAPDPDACRDQAYDGQPAKWPERWRLHGYANDVRDILREADLRDVISVGHSVGAMISVLAAAKEPERFGTLAILCALPRYVDEANYLGGFSREDVDKLLA